jgi:hypothetical protein
MQIRVYADENIDSCQELTIRVEGVVEGSLQEYLDRVTLVEVHLSRRRSHHVDDRDMCCRMEAHLGALKPLEVIHEALTLTEAIHAASSKLEHLVHAALGRRKSNDTAASEAEEVVGPSEGLGQLGRP